MLESGDVMGTFVGHNHINDYIGVQYGIALAYGRITKTIGDPTDPKAGGRVIVLKKENENLLPGLGKRMAIKYLDVFILILLTIKIKIFKQLFNSV